MIEKRTTTRRQNTERITRRFAASGAITRIKGNAERVNLSLVARELTAPPDGKPLLCYMPFWGQRTVKIST
jgi:hypothetical protein